MTSPVVSVLMPVWCPDPGFLRRAVDSVLAQTMADLELVIVEDPGGIPVAEMQISDDPRVRVISNPRRTSLVAQRNRGLAAARGGLVAMLDADDIALPERLALQVRHFAEASATVLGSAIAIVDAHERHLMIRRYPTCHADVVAAMRRENPLAQSAVMARRDALLAVGGYRFAVEHTGEDYELWSRLARCGARFANLDEVTIRYRIHDGASKSTRLRALLRSTLAVKRHHWRDEMSAADRLRMIGETALLGLPPTWVSRLFLMRQWALARRRSLR